MLYAGWTAYGVPRRVGTEAMVRGGFTDEQVRRYGLPAWMNDAVAAVAAAFLRSYSTLTEQQRQVVDTLADGWAGTCDEMLQAARALAPDRSPGPSRVRH